MRRNVIIQAVLQVPERVLLQDANPPEDRSSYEEKVCSALKVLLEFFFGERVLIVCDNILRMCS